MFVQFRFGLSLVMLYHFLFPVSIFLRFAMRYTPEFRVFILLPRRHREIYSIVYLRIVQQNLVFRWFPIAVSFVRGKIIMATPHHCHVGPSLTRGSPCVPR